MPYLYERWAAGIMAQREGVGEVPERGLALSILLLQTPSGSQSYKQQTSLYHPTSKICFMLSLIEDSYLIDPSPAACRLRWEGEENQFGSHGALLFSKFTGLSLCLSLCLFNGERTALCSNFEQRPCGHSSPSCGRELCYSAKKSGATPLLDQMAYEIYSQPYRLQLSAARR